MFARFLQSFKPIPDESTAADARRPWPHGDVEGFSDLTMAFAGRGFNDGVYRIHTESSGRVADSLVQKGVPWLSGRLYAFGYTWDGMQIGLDASRRSPDGEPQILIVDPSDWSVYQVECTFAPFHNDELVDYPDESLDSHLFDAWSWENQHLLPLKHGQIVGFKIPLSLGGADSIENMMVIDLAVEVELNVQIASQTRHLPDGTPIEGVRVTS